MLFDLFSRKDINKGVEDWRTTDGAVLLDVRTKEEYRDRHIDGSMNIPLGEIERVLDLIKDRDTPIFVHCLSGVRSADASVFLKDEGYSRVTDIGGISSYRGETV